MDTIQHYDFDLHHFTLNVTARVLTQEGREHQQVVLPPQEMALLQLLLSKHPGFCTYEEAMQAVSLELSDVRVVLRCLNVKLAPFGLIVDALLETGFLIRRVQ